MRQVVDRARGCLHPEKLNHVYGFLLFRKVSCGRCSNPVIGICPEVNFGTTATDVHATSTKHLTSAMTLDKSVQLHNSRRQSGTVDLVSFYVNQRATSVLILVPLLAQKMAWSRCELPSVLFL